MWESTQFPDRHGRKPTDIICDGPAFSHLPRRFKGTWLADNPLVWPVLEPILRLATRMIMTFHTTSFVCMSLFVSLFFKKRGVGGEGRLYS